MVALATQWDKAGCRHCRGHVDLDHRRSDAPWCLMQDAGSGVVRKSPLRGHRRSDVGLYRRDCALHVRRDDAPARPCTGQGGEGDAGLGGQPANPG